MYESLFDLKLATAAAALVLATLAGSLAGNVRLGWRGMAYSHTPALAAAFYLLAPLGAPLPDAIDAVAGFVLEFCVLGLFYVLFARLCRMVQTIDNADARRLLRLSLLLQLAVSWPMVTAEGFGLFSEGSRLEYLAGSATAKYYTYMGFLLGVLQAPLIASRITATGSPGRGGLAVIALTFVVSIMAGSKGGVFLWLLSVVVLVDYRRAPVSPTAIFVALTATGALVAVSSAIVADALGISLQEFIDLVSSRFFLNNDARALAFDQRYATAAMDGSLFGESFRSLANLLGVPPRNEPLGLMLYAELLGLETGNGANASLMALIIYYSPPGYALLPALVAALGAALMTVCFYAAQRALRGGASRAGVLALGLTALQQFSQDFLAFQVVMPLVLIAIVALWLYDLWHHRSVRPTRRLVSDPQHRHSSA